HTAVYALSLHDALPISMLASGKITTTAPVLCIESISIRKRMFVKGSRRASGVIPCLALARGSRDPLNSFVGELERFDEDLVPLRSEEHTSELQSLPYLV